MTSELPEPLLERWQPLRAGLVDLFYYDTEEFWVRDGRLLRGNNGTGKSKVVARPALARFAYAEPVLQGSGGRERR